MSARESLVEELEWNNNIKNKDQKEKLANRIALEVKNGDVISFGSGTTAFLAAKAIGKRCTDENIHITAVPTSNQIKLLCDYLEIKTANLEECKIDWGFDGADEVDKNNWLIKGMGGALYREKLNMKQTPKMYILVDKSKLVDKLGKDCPVPVECSINKVDVVKNELLKLGALECNIRRCKKKDEVFVTDNGNYIIDAMFNNIFEDMEAKINAIDGVLENGLFIGYNNIEIICT